MFFKDRESFVNYIYNNLGVEAGEDYAHDDPRTFIKTSLEAFFSFCYEENEIREFIDKETMNFLTKTLPFFAEALSLQYNFYQFSKTPASLIYYAENNKGNKISELHSYPVIAQTFRFKNEKRFIKNLKINGKRLLLESIPKSIINLPFNSEEFTYNALMPYSLSLQKIENNSYLLIRVAKKQVYGNNIKFIRQEKAQKLAKNIDNLFITG